MQTPRPPSGPSTRIAAAVEEAAEARAAGRHREAVDRLSTAATLLGTGPVRRELRVALARELGLAWLALDKPRDARDQLMLAHERADGEPALADPLRAALAALELMSGDALRARRWLDGRGRDRRATLIELARAALFEGQIDEAEELLQACEQAPGGTSGVAPPSTALRCMAAVWTGRAEQARMLYDGVAASESDHWQLVRRAILRTVWVGAGGGRYLRLALGAAEQLRFDPRRDAPLPGVAAAAAAHHALLLILTGDLGLAVDAADAALSHLGDLTLPEWPRQAILHDLAVVYREAGMRERHHGVLERWDAVPTAGWPERMRRVTGARADGAVAPSTRRAGAELLTAGLADVALRLFEDPHEPHAVVLTGLCEHLGAWGARWIDHDGRAIARVGTALAAAGSDGLSVPARLDLEGSWIELYGARASAVSRIDLALLERLAAAARARVHEIERRRALDDALRLADAGRRAAEDALERTRRPGSVEVVGGRFRSVVGRSVPVREILDRLAALAPLRVPVLLDGKSGSGRRHLARALDALGRDDAPPCPIVDAALIPSSEQQATLSRLIGAGRTGHWIVANAEHLSAAACSWLIGVASDPGAGSRVLVTLDEQADTPVAQRLRASLSAGRIRVPGLDERLEDLPLLIDAFAREVGRRPDEVSTAARAVLARRAWAGHVAELRRAIHQAAVRADRQTLLPEHFEAGAEEAAQSLSESIEVGYHDAVRGFRRELLRHALGMTGGNRTRAAELLGLQRTYFMRLIRDLGATENA